MEPRPDSTYKHLLLVGYHYPPENAVGAARPARFAKYLPGFGWQCEVITAAEQERGGLSQVHWLPDATRAHWEGSGGSPTAPVVQRWSELLLRRFLFPGAIGLGWSSRIPRVVNGLLPRMGAAPQAVLSSFPPLAAHLAGWRLSRRLGLPWIADFRDPFAPAVEKSGSWLAAATASKQEGLFFCDAAAVIANTEAMAAMYRERYPTHADKVSVIWNGFDPDEVLGPIPIPRRKGRVLTHLGTLYAGRNPIAVLESFERLRRAGNTDALGCEVALVGPNYGSPGELMVIQRCNDQGWLTVTAGKLPRDEALRLGQQSDGLLLLQPQSDTQVPGKLFEYLRIGRPILSLAPKGSPIEWILDNAGVPHVDLYPTDALGELDQKVASYLALSSDATELSPWFQENFNAERQAFQLATLLDAVTAEAANRDFQCSNGGRP